MEDEKDETCNQSAPSTEQDQHHQSMNQNEGESNNSSNDENYHYFRATGTGGRPLVWRDVAFGVAAGTAAVAAAPLVLSAVGFGSGGIVAGSLAASIQSTLYGGATTGMFAAVQSAGMTGIGSTASAAIGGTFAGAAVAARRLLIGSDEPAHGTPMDDKDKEQDQS